MPSLNHEITDHDLLIRLDEKTDSIRGDIQEIKEHLASKADSTDLEALQKRVGELEQVVRLQGNAITAVTAATNSTVKTVGSAIGWTSGLVTIVHYLLVK